MNLYKYRPWNEFTKDVIINNRIYFPTREKLNDPAELIHEVEFIENFDSVKIQELENNLPSEYISEAINIGGEISRLKSNRHLGAMKILQNYKEGKGMYLNEWDKKVSEFESQYGKVNLEKELLFDKIVDLEFAIKIYTLFCYQDNTLLYITDQLMRNSLFEKLNRLGVFSLSSNPKSPVMWAHYGDNHLGVILVFRPEGDSIISKSKRITYVSQRPKLDPTTIYDNLFVKSTEWSYEEEYRIIIKNGDSVVSILDNELIGVIAGCKMPRTIKEEIFDLCRQRNISVYEAFKNDSNFEIQFK